MKLILGTMLAALSLAAPAHAQDKVRIAVGGKSAVFYLPLSVTERLGYFKDAGLDVEISDVQSGARTLQSIVGNSADIGVGTFDHAIQMQAKNQPVIALVQYGRYPGFVLATIASKNVRYTGPQDLKGLKIGVTSPGSSTHFLAAYMMIRAGLKADDASFIGTGTTATAVAAARRAEIDAIVSSDPMMTLMQHDKLVKVIAEHGPSTGLLDEVERYVRWPPAGSHPAARATRAHLARAGAAAPAACRGTAGTPPAHASARPAAAWTPAARAPGTCPSAAWTRPNAASAPGPARTGRGSRWSGPAAGPARSAAPARSSRGGPPAGRQEKGDSGPWGAPEVQACAHPRPAPPGRA